MTATVRRAPVLLTFESMREALATHLGQTAESITEDEDLVELGLDSIGIMRIANLCKRGGAEIGFDEFISSPTLSSWWRIASSRLAQPVATTDEADIDEFAPFELGSMQQAYWIGSTQGHSLGSVSAHYYLELDGRDVDPDRLDGALRAVHALHPMLRAQFLPDGRQRIMSEAHWQRLALDDLSLLPAEECDRRLHAARTSLANRRLVVEQGEVFDVRLTRMPGGRTRLHINISMLVCDARSFQILLDDIARLYAEPAYSLEILRYSFQRFLRDKVRLAGDTKLRAKTYWQERLGSLPSAPQLPMAVAPTELDHQTHAHLARHLTPDVRESLTRQARRHGVSLPTVFLTAFAEVLALWSAEPRFLLNLPFFDRDAFSPEVARLVGDFTNVLLLDTDLSKDLPFVEQARAAHARFVEAAAHADYPGVELLRDLARTQTSPGIAAPVVFTSTIGLGELFSDDVRRCLGTPVWISSQTPQVWLDHQVIEWDGGLLLNVDFVRELFAPGLVSDLFNGYLLQIERLASSDAAWLSPACCSLPDRQQVVRARTNAAHRLLSPGVLHGAFFSHAAREPDRPALFGSDGTVISYGALADRALLIGSALAAQGVAAGDTVAILLPKGFDQIAGVLGVLAAGAAFVPIALDSPPSRQLEMCRSAGVRKILTVADGNTAFDWPRTDAIGVRCPSPARLPSPVGIAADALAYVIYTSGSTGAPKGVEMTHAAALNTIEDINARFEVGPNDRVLGVSALEFDLSIYDIFGLLSAGGAVVLVAEDRKRDPGHLLDQCIGRRATLWNSVPALLEMLLVAAEAGGKELPLRLALVSGDWIGLDLPRRLRSRAETCRFISLGGATEAAIWSIAFEVDHIDPAWHSIPYGLPLANQAFRVVDARGRDRPDGVPGELWIGGQGLARGYRGDPDKTANKFVTQGTARWYRTGDLGRYRPDGVIEFLGRTDLQIKIRGHRIELGEIEAALASHPQIRQAAAFAAGPDRQSLASAIVLTEGQLDVAVLRSFLAERLPGYMVPARIRVLPQMPLTENGKVDRQALLRSAADDQDFSALEPPRPGLESEIAELWRTFLHHHAGAESSFFAIGGDSLISVRLLDLVHRNFGVRVSLRQFFARPTIRALASTISRHAAEVDEEEGVI
jgi:amino acid adenylation domain-containing protein